jgi:type I restriction enzyme S subunit
MIGDLVTIEEHITTLKGFAFKSAWYTETGVPIVKVSDFTQDSVSPEKVAYIPIESSSDFEKYKLEKGDVLIQTVGSWEHNPNSVVGKVVRIPEVLNDSLLNQNIVKIIPKETLDKSFLFYLLKNDAFKGYIIKTAQGAANQASITLESIKAFKFIYKDKTTQRKIASILSAYDDLIENNLKRIKLLEEKALMEYRILYSSSKLNEFPIEDVWEIKYGKNLPQTKITEKGKYPVYGAAGRIGFYEEFNYEFPVALVTSRGNGSGVAHRTNQAAFVTNNSFAFVPKLDFSEVHFHLAEMILRDLELTQLRSGTAQPQLTISGLTGVKMKLPKKEALIEFNIINDPSFDLIHTLEKQNTKLREARDILLPKLMNGQIEV